MRMLFKYQSLVIEVNIMGVTKSNVSVARRIFHVIYDALTRFVG
ncbi:hypothetical protein [Listeria portnoyi]|nr:hypothetical protein [Listeria portnoyi]